MPKIAEFQIADAQRRAGKNRQIRQAFLAAIAIFAQRIVIVAP